MRIFRTFLVVGGLFAMAGPIPAQEQKPARPDLTQLFEKREVMIPVRDGVKLHTEIYTPKQGTGALPLFMERSPYGISDASKGHSPLLFNYAEMWADGYIFVLQDIRGRYGSEGVFEMNRSVHDPRDAKGVDESTDTYDTIEWLIKNVPNNNGRVGIAGVSYGGFLATMALVNPHPALKAVSEQACMGDAWMGDDFFHNGAFRLSYGFEYSALMETSKENFSFAFDSFDLFDWYLRLGTLSNANARYFHGNIPTWTNFTKHPSYDEFWKRHAVE
jgi:predicted acyl esterase